MLSVGISREDTCWLLHVLCYRRQTCLTAVLIALTREGGTAYTQSSLQNAPSSSFLSPLDTPEMHYARGMHKNSVILSLFSHGSGAPTNRPRRAVNRVCRERGGNLGAT